MKLEPLPRGQWVPLTDIPGLSRALRREGAYVPPPLPPELTLPAATYRCAALAEHALGRLDEAAARLRARDGLVRSTQVRDAQSSAQLGGVRVQLREALAAELLASQGSAKRADLLPLLTPYLRAYDHGLRRVRAGARVDVSLISELSAIMTGRTAQSVTDVLRTGHGFLGGESGPYLVTAHGPHLPVLLEQWSDWAGTERDLPRVVHLAVAHYQLEVLQPFPTANGHVARGFSMVAMVRNGLLRDQILPLSVWLDDSLDSYQREIRAVVDTGEIHRWITFFATALHDQALAQLRLIEGLGELADELGRMVGPAGTAARVLADVVGFPVINHRAIEERYRVSTKYATDVTRRLVRLGVLTTWESRKYDQIFLCEPALDLMVLAVGTSADVRRPGTPRADRAKEP